jgi:hypothetical protein
VVPLDTDGVTVGKDEPMLGLRERQRHLRIAAGVLGFQWVGEAGRHVDGVLAEVGRHRPGHRRSRAVQRRVFGGDECGGLPADDGPIQIGLDGSVGDCGHGSLRCRLDRASYID